MLDLVITFSLAFASNSYAGFVLREHYKIESQYDGIKGETTKSLKKSHKSLKLFFRKYRTTAKPGYDDLSNL